MIDTCRSPLGCFEGGAICSGLCRALHTTLEVLVVLLFAAALTGRPGSHTRKSSKPLQAPKATAGGALTAWEEYFEDLEEDSDAEQSDGDDPLDETYTPGDW